MKKIYSLVLAVALICLVAGCSKNKIPLPAPAPVETPKNLLDSIVWNDIHETTYFKYRADSLPDKILYGFPVTKDTVSFKYTGNQLTQITSSRSQRASDYQYNAAGKIAVITMHAITGLSTSFILEFSYDNAGKPVLLDYFLKNERGIQLQYSATYQYSTAGLLEKVTQTTPGGIVITHAVEAYSDECTFTPWAFIDPVTTTENMAIYNLPVLQTMNKLPGIITTTFINRVEYIKRNQFTIQNDRIDKMVTVVEFPASPALDYQTRLNFFYHQ
jgi:hypothetical protein